MKSLSFFEILKYCSTTARLKSVFTHFIFTLSKLFEIGR